MMRITAFRLLVVLALLALAGAWLAQDRHWRVPDRWNPWAPLDLAETPGWLTRYKLGRLGREPALCKAVLATATMRFEAVPDRVSDTGCGWRNALRIRATTAAIGAPFVLSCESAVSLALWERHVLQPAALRHFGQPVVAIDHWGSYACRSIAGRADGRLSRHAEAEALDIAGFRLAGGRRISVRRDWAGAAPEAALLREAHRGACGVFDGVLGPGYNAAHADHLHLDRGPYRICR